MLREVLGHSSDARRQTWDWMYGQTPDFTHRLEHSFSWANVVCSKLIVQVDAVLLMTVG